MTKYSLNFLKHIDLTDSEYASVAARFPTAELERQVRVSLTVNINAPSLRDAMVEANRGEGIGRYAHYVKRKSSGWYSIDVIHAIDRALVRNAHGGPFTPEEQLNPDVILTSVPANGTQEVIRAARKRFNRLHRLLIIREFCLANPGLSFERPDAYTRGVTVLTLIRTQCRINTIPSHHRIRVRTNSVNEVIEPTDNHRFNLIINHQQAVDADLAAQHAAQVAQQPAVPFPATQDSAFPHATYYYEDDYQAAAYELDEAAELEAAAAYNVAHPATNNSEPVEIEDVLGPATEPIPI